MTRKASRAYGRPAVPSAVSTVLTTQPGQHVAVVVADAAREQIDAEILQALRGEAGDQRGAGDAAHRGDAGAAHAAPHSITANTARLNANWETKRPSRPAVTKPNWLLAQSLGLVADAGCRSA